MLAPPDPTPRTLLDRLREANDAAAWNRFVELYAPVVLAWVGRLGVDPADRADVSQDVFVRLVTALPTFRYDPDRRFRGWLFTVVRSAVHDARRARRPNEPLLVEVADRDAPDPPWVEEEYRRHLRARVLEVLRGEFDPRVWGAFWAYTVEGRPAAEIATELGVAVDWVYRASRVHVLPRLRRELDGLL